MFYNSILIRASFAIHSSIWGITMTVDDYLNSIRIAYTPTVGFSICKYGWNSREKYGKVMSTYNISLGTGVIRYPVWWIIFIYSRPLSTFFRTQSSTPSISNNIIPCCCLYTDMCIQMCQIWSYYGAVNPTHKHCTAVFVCQTLSRFWVNALRNVY